MGSRAQEPSGRMDLEVKHRCIRQPVRQWRPSPAPICRVPDADISTHIDVIRAIAIHNECVVLDIQEISSSRTLRATSHLPAVPVEMPDAARIAKAAKRYINRIEGCITPIDGDI